MRPKGADQTAMDGKRPHRGRFSTIALMAVLAVVVLPSTATAQSWKPGPAKYDIGKQFQNACAICN
jgi:hypothetical protein